MKVGFIGAGKVGFTLGRYFAEHGAHLSGYYSRTEARAQEAAQFTGSEFYSEIDALVSDSDIIFVTTTDGEIQNVSSRLAGLPLYGKIVCHCSGSLSSAVFSELAPLGAFIYSAHPLFSIHDKYNSCKQVSSAVFTLEGSPERIDCVQGFISACGNRVQVISGENKAKYHAAAVAASNLTAALMDMSMELLQECGFSRRSALEALSPLFENNAANVARLGPMDALTGPVERGDVETVSRHMQCLKAENRQLYALLSMRLADIAGIKHPDRDYSQIKEVLSK